MNKLNFLKLDLATKSDIKDQQDLSYVLLRNLLSATDVSDIQFSSVRVCIAKLNTVNPRELAQSFLEFEPFFSPRASLDTKNPTFLKLALV